MSLFREAEKMKQELQLSLSHAHRQIQSLNCHIYQRKLSIPNQRSFINWTFFPKKQTLKRADDQIFYPFLSKHFFFLLLLPLFSFLQLDQFTRACAHLGIFYSFLDNRTTGSFAFSLCSTISIGSIVNKNFAFYLLQLCFTSASQSFTFLDLQNSQKWRILPLILTLSSPSNMHYNLQSILTNG